MSSTPTSDEWARCSLALRTGPPALERALSQWDLRGGSAPPARRSCLQQVAKACLQQGRVNPCEAVWSVGIVITQVQHLRVPWVFPSAARLPCTRALGNQCTLHKALRPTTSVFGCETTCTRLRSRKPATLIDFTASARGCTKRRTVRQDPKCATTSWKSGA